MKRRQFLQLTSALAAVPLAIKLTGCGGGEDDDTGPTTTGGPTTTTGGGGGNNGAFRINNSDALHPHSFVVVCADFDMESVTYTASGSGHPHSITLDGTQLEMIADGQSVSVTTTDGGHSHTWDITMPANGCDGPAQGPTDETTDTAGW